MKSVLRAVIVGISCASLIGLATPANAVTTSQYVGAVARGVWNSAGLLTSFDGTASVSGVAMNTCIPMSQSNDGNVYNGAANYTSAYAVLYETTGCTIAVQVVNPKTIEPVKTQRWHAFKLLSTKPALTAPGLALQPAKLRAQARINVTNNHSEADLIHFNTNVIRPVFGSCIRISYPGQSLNDLNGVTEGAGDEAAGYLTAWASTNCSGTPITANMPILAYTRIGNKGPIGSIRVDA